MSVGLPEKNEETYYADTTKKLWKTDREENKEPGGTVTFRTGPVRADVNCYELRRAGIDVANCSWCY